MTTAVVILVTITICLILLGVAGFVLFDVMQERELRRRKQIHEINMTERREGIR